MPERRDKHGASRSEMPSSQGRPSRVLAPRSYLFFNDLSEHLFVERQIGDIFFSLPFSSSSWRSRFISEGINPAYFLRQLMGWTALPLRPRLWVSTMMEVIMEVAFLGIDLAKNRWHCNDECDAID